MPESLIKITVKPPFRDLLGRFVKADKAILEEKRQMLRRLGQRWVVIAREEAPNRRGDFRKSIIYRTFVQGQNVILKGYSAHPLHEYITRGTVAHIIRPIYKKALKFLWEGGPRSTSAFTAYHFYRLVHHPGTQPNPYHRRAYARWKYEAIPELRRLALKYVQVMQA